MVDIGDKIRIFKAGKGTTTIEVDRVRKESGFASAIDVRWKTVFTRQTNDIWRDSLGNEWKVLGPEVPVVIV